MATVSHVSQTLDSRSCPLPKPHEPKLTPIREYDSLPAEMMDAPSLHDGKLYGSDTQGNVVALDRFGASLKNPEIWPLIILTVLKRD